MPSVPPQNSNFNQGHDTRAADYFAGDEKKKEKEKKSGGNNAMLGAAAGLAVGGIGGAIIAHEMSKLSSVASLIKSGIGLVSQPSRQRSSSVPISWYFCRTFANEDHSRGLR